MDTWNRLTAVRGEGGSGKQVKEGGRISQRNYIHEPQTHRQWCGDGQREGRVGAGRSGAKLGWEEWGHLQ